MNLYTKHKFLVSCEYDHHWIHHPLVIKFLVDDTIIHIDVNGNSSNKFNKTVVVDHSEDNMHKFSIEISAKTNENVILDDNKNAIKDTVLTIKDLQFDQISIASMLSSGNFAEFYVHDTGKVKTNSLILAENGILHFSFSVPINQWLLEKLF